MDKSTPNRSPPCPLYSEPFIEWYSPSPPASPLDLLMSTSSSPPIDGDASRFYPLLPGELAGLATLSDDSSLANEIDLARVTLRRVMAQMDQTPADPETLAKLGALVMSGARTIARLLRDQRALTGQAADGIAGAIGQALDELSIELGIEL